MVNLLSIIEQLLRLFDSYLTLPFSNFIKGQN